MSTQPPKLSSVSVVIPTYNYGHFIGDAIESALAQTYPPNEIIVIDDGSSDGTADVCWPYLPRIQYIRQSNGGVSRARNAGIEAAGGEWIAFLDADDLWDADKLLLQMRCAAEHPGVCLIGGYNHQARLREQAREPVTLLDQADFLGGLPFGTSSAVARRKALLDAGGFNPERHYAEDRELWLKLTEQASAARINRALWSYRRHPNQAIAQAARMAENYRAVLDAFFAAHPKIRNHHAAALAYYHYDSAVAFFDARKPSRALQHLLRSFAALPLRLPAFQSEGAFNRAALLCKLLAGERIFKRLCPLGKALLRRTPQPEAN